MSNRIQVHITGIGSYLPRKVVINDDYNYRAVGVEPMWLQFSGYKSRRVADVHDTTVSMAAEAGAMAVAMAGIDPGEIDLLLFANATFDNQSVVPAGAPKVAAQLGAKRALAYSIKEACHGFVLALDQAARLIEAGVYRHVLVVTAETFTRSIDGSSNLSMKLGLSMGDGGGAILLSAGPDDVPGLLGSFAETNGELAGSVALQAKTVYSLADGAKAGIYFGFNKSKDDRRDSRNRDSLDEEFQNLKELTLSILPKSVNSALERAGLKTHQIDRFIFHQPNRVFLEEWRDRLGIPKDKMFDTLELFGNVSNSTLPITLCEAVRQGIIGQGDTFCLASMGEGVGYGAQIWKWTADPGRVPMPQPERSIVRDAQLRKNLVNVERHSGEELRDGYIRPGLRERLSWDEAYGRFVNVHGFAEGVDPEAAWQYVSNIKSLEEWTMSVRNIEPMGEWQGRKRYRAEDSLAPGGVIYFLEKKVPEGRTVQWWVGHSPEDIWMSYCMRVLDGRAVLGRPGAVITWVNFAHANFERNEILCQGFRLMPLAHGLERDNLIKILESRHGSKTGPGGAEK